MEEAQRSQVVVFLFDQQVQIRDPSDISDPQSWTSMEEAKTPQVDVGFIDPPPKAA